MKIKTEYSENEYQNNLKFLTDSIKLKGTLVDTEFNVVKKSGIKWLFLRLCQPFYAAFGKDVFSHVRIQNVSKNIFEYLELNQKFASDSTKELEKTIWDALIAKSPKHKVELEKVQKSIPFLHSCKWADSPDKIDLTESEQLQIDRAIRSVLLSRAEGYQIRVLKRTWTLYKEGQKDIVHQLPRTVLEIGNEWILNTRVIIAKGGQRRVKGAYSLTEGKHLVKKMYQGDERVIFEFFSKRKFSCIVNTRHILLNPKPRVYEDFCEGTLRDFFETQAFKELPTKIALISDLLQGLVNLYTIPLEISGKSFDFSHRDLDLSNIFINQDDAGYYHAVIGDIATLPGAPIKKTGWAAPEFLRSEPFDNVIEFNREFGRNIDIWQIGLLMSIIMMSKALYADSKPLWTLLPSIAAAIRKGFAESLEPRDILIKDLTQENLDKDIEDAKKFSLNSHINKRMLRMHQGLHQEGIVAIWDLIRDCLRVEPKHRISAGRALQVFQEIVRRMPLV